MHCYRNVVISIPHNYSNKTWYYYFQTFLLSCIYWKWWYVVFDRRAIHVTCTKSHIFFFSHNIHAFELIYVLGEPRNTYHWNASSVVGSCVAPTRLIFLLLVLVWQQQWFFSYWWFLCGSSKTSYCWFLCDNNKVSLFCMLGQLGWWDVGLECEVDVHG